MALKLISTNKKARRDYKILETYEAGIVLKGMEVKSLRMRGCSIDEAFVRVEGAQVFIYNMHIPELTNAAYFKVDPKRVRKLLLNKQEIKKLIGSINQKGLTFIPTKAFFSLRGLAKIEIGLAKGMKTYDKRKKLKDEIVNKETQRALKNYKRY